MQEELVGIPEVFFTAPFRERRRGRGKGEMKWDGNKMHKQSRSSVSVILSFWLVCLASCVRDTVSQQLAVNGRFVSGFY